MNIVLIHTLNHEWHT